MTSVVRLTCLAAIAALALGACTPKSSGNAGPSFVDSGAREVRADRGNDAGADDTAASDTSANPDATTDTAAPDVPADAPVNADAPADTSAPTSDTAPGDAGSPDARDSAGDPTISIDLPGLDLRDALSTDLGADTRDGAGG
jgi:hypothetical protein